MQWITIALSSIGKIGASAAMATVLLYTAELFPTVIRSSGMGAASFFARIGGMIAPYLIEIVRIYVLLAGLYVVRPIFGLKFV